MLLFSVFEIFIIGLVEVNWGSSKYGSFFAKLHDKSSFFIEVCDVNGCKIYPADIEVYDNNRRNDSFINVYLSKIYKEDGSVFNFTQKNSLFGLSLSILDLICYREKGVTIQGCYLGFYPQKFFQRCIDSDGNVWNVRLPYTKEVVR